MLGRPEKATEFIQRSLELDPLSSVSYYNLGLALHASARFLEAEAAYRKGLELDPERLLTHSKLSLALLAQDRGEEALAEATREQEAQARLCTLAVVHHRLSHGAESNQALQELIERFADGSAFQIEEAYAARGEADEAFGWLARAYAQRDPGITVVKVSWPLRSLHADPRWVPLLEKLGLGR
jgi:tetratricopeptide (TPR) repeat protein